jgi:hypothetical protein
MLKTYGFLTAFFIFTGSLTAQKFEWVFQDGGWSWTNQGLFVVNDNHENAYVTGWFYHYANHQPSGSFISKLNADGNKEWIKTTLTDNFNFRVIGMDSLGNIYVYGFFYGPSLTFGNKTIYSDGVGGYFFARFSSLEENLNNCVWSKYLGRHSLASYCVDKAGNVFFSAGVDSDTWGAVTIDNQSIYGFGAYIGKINKDGICEWLKNSGDGGGAAYNITTNLNKNIIISGELSNFRTIRIGTGPNSVVFDSIQGWFLAQFDSLGNIKWARKGYGIITDSLNNIYGLGGGGIEKYDNEGNLLWTRKITGGGPKEFAIGPDQNIYIAGTIYENAKFDHITIEHSPGTTNMFAAKYNSDGKVQWVIHPELMPYDSWNSFSYGSSICADYKGNIWVTGNFSGNVKFGNTVLSCEGGGYEDVFVVKIFDDGTVVPDTTTGTAVWSTVKASSSLLVYPNPAKNNINILLHSETSESLNVLIRNLTGAVIYQCIEQSTSGTFQKEINLQNHSPGIYFVELQTGQERIVRKIVLSR